MKRILQLSILISIGYLPNAQELQNGLVLPNNYDTKGICCIYVPINGFNIHDKPNGQRVGTLTRNVEINKGDQSYYRIYLDRDQGQPEPIDLGNFREIGYAVWAITYFERSNGFLRILSDRNSYWINEKEITSKDFKVQEWPDFLISKARHLLGFYANEPGLNLRTAPNINSEVLKTLKGDLFEITPTNEREGLWVKVKVKKYKEHICRSTLSDAEILEYELNGWIKLVDDSGSPNVWYYSRGC